MTRIKASMIGNVDHEDIVNTAFAIFERDRPDAWVDKYQISCIPTVSDFDEVSVKIWAHEGPAKCDFKINFYVNSWKV